jgi:hypothetical protein
MPPSRHQLAALSACLDAPDGSAKQAAHTMGLTYSGMRSLLSRLYRDLDVTTQAQAVARLDDAIPGWRPATTCGAPQDNV